METTRVIGISYPEGDHLRVEITETEFQIFQKIMKEEKLKPYEAFEKMTEIVDKETSR